MAKTYFFSFGSGAASSYSGLSPTFIIFHEYGVTALTPPGVTETPAGSGFYQFTYGPTTPIVFEIDGTASITNASDRYIKGALDPIQVVDERIGTVADTIGTTNVDPTTIFGYEKRAQEFFEGDKVYTKATGVWQNNTRGGTLIVQKQLTNTTSQATSD